MSSHWFVITTRTSESISNPTSVFFWIWWFFSLPVFCQGLFWNTGFVHVHLRLCKVRQVFIDWSLIEVPWFSSSETLFISSDIDIFMMKLLLSSRFVLHFLSLLDILCKEAISTISFLNAMTSMIRKRSITFYFKSFFLMKMFWNYKK